MKTKPLSRNQRARQSSVVADTALVDRKQDSSVKKAALLGKSNPAVSATDEGAEPLAGNNRFNQQDNSKQAASPRNLSICIFEDSATPSHAIIEKLIEYGHSVDNFSDASEALKALATSHYDLLLIGQTNDSGLECMYFIKSFCSMKKPIKPKFPIIVLTSDTSPKNIKSLTHAGANLIMAKYINGKLNNNIFEVTQIISTIPRSKSDTEEPNIPELNIDLSTETTSKNKLHVPQPNLKKPSMKAKASSTLLNDEVRENKNDSPMNDELENATKPTRRSPFFGLSQRITIIGIGMIALISAAFVYWQGNIAAVPVEVVKARQGVLMKSINASGRVISRKQVDLASGIAGQLVKVFVEEGSTVKEGDVLAMLDDRGAAISIQQAKAELAHLKSDVDLKTRSLAQLKQTSDTGSVTSVIVKDLESSLASAKAKQRIASEDLRAAQLAFDKLKIVAPFDAIVLESYAVAGVWAEPWQPLFKLIDPSRFEAAISVDGADASEIDIGQPVIMSNNVLADEWTGNVVRVAFNTNDLARGDETLVYASLGDQAPRVHYGQPVDTRIVTKTSGEAIKLPFEAVFEREGRTLVAVVENNRVKFQPVDLGIQDLTDVEVVSGLNIGQSVVLPGVELEEGARVKVSIVAMSESEDELGFPYREKYPGVAVITTEQLRKSFHDSIVVDARSNFEFDVVHVSNAVNIPLSSTSFLRQLEDLRDKNGTQPIVFYCNGHTCTKSYKAAQKATAAGFANVYAYDSGIFDWLRANRDYTTLLDTSPAPLSKLVSAEYFQSRLLNFEQFQEKAVAEDVIVIDIRDDFQKTTKLAMPAVGLPLDQLLAKLNAGEFKDKQLLIFDAVGKQVRWLQYVLKDKGYKNYYFLRDGIAGAAG